MDNNNERGVILIVDDEKESAQSLKGLFVGMGYDVLTVPDEAEATKTISAISFDLIIIEVNMLNGIKVLKYIKSKKPKAKIIVYSRCDYKTKKEAEEIGVDEFLPKRIEIPMLVDAVRYVLKR